MSHPTDRIDRALSTRETLRATYDMARNCIERGVPGDFVECGVFAGAQCAAMALAIIDDVGTVAYIKHYGPSRRVHLFDSFEGIPAGGPHDLDWKAGGLKPGESACSLEQVKANMREWGIPDELLVYHPGWFIDTILGSSGLARAATILEVPFSEISDIVQPLPESIALMRLDGDLYESTKVCLEYLYPLLSPGGWLVVDDFGLDGCRKAVLEYFAPSAPWPLYFQKP